MRGFRFRFSRRLVGLLVEAPRRTREKKPLVPRVYVLPRGPKFRGGEGGGVLIFAIFPGIHKNKFLQIKITAKIFPAKIYSRVIFSNLNSLHKHTVLRNRVS